MANLDDSRPEPKSPRREPPVIEAEAVEIPVGGASAPRSRRFVSPHVGWIAAAVVLVAIVASVAGWWALSPGETGADKLGARVAQVEAQRRDDATRLDANTAAIAKLEDLSARIARLESAPAPRNDAPAIDRIANGLAAVEAMLKTVGGRLDTIDRRTQDTERRSQDNAAALRATTARTEALAADVAALKKDEAPAAPGPQERAALDGFAARIDAVEARLKAMGEQVDASARVDPAAAVAAATQPLRTTLAAVALRLAVERGSPFAPELDAARAAARDPKALAALAPFASTGVPTADNLAREMSALVPALTRASTPASRDGSYLDSLRAGAEKLVRIRPVGEAPGDDATAVIGRIASKVERADIDGIGAELERLPPAARDLAQPWRARAMHRVAAIDAARAFAAQAFASLGTAPR
jgi:hypothetical protein